MSISSHGLGITSPLLPSGFDPLNRFSGNMHPDFRVPYFIAKQHLQIRQQWYGLLATFFGVNPRFISKRRRCELQTKSLHVQFAVMFVDAF